MIDSIIKKIIKEWSEKENCLGILLSGSYAYGIHNKNSDIDIRIILADTSIFDSTFGVDYINGKQVSIKKASQYQFYKQMHLELKAQIKSEARNFAIGKIIYDKKKTLKFLKKEAKFLMQVEFEKINDNKKQLLKYRIKENFERVLFLEESNDYYTLNFYHSLNEVLKLYSEILNYELIPEHKYSLLFGSNHFRESYNIKEFSDTVFLKIWQKALIRKDKKSLIEVYKYLKNKIEITDKYVFSYKLDGF